MSRFYVTKITQEPGYEEQNHVTVELSTQRAKPLLNLGGSKLTIGPMLEAQAARFKIGAAYEVEVSEVEEEMAHGGGSGG